jgi:competence transcription factor ComK
MQQNAIWRHGWCRQAGQQQAGRQQNKNQVFSVSHHDAIILAFFASFFNPRLLQVWFFIIPWIRHESPEGFDACFFRATNYRILTPSISRHF